MKKIIFAIAGAAVCASMLLTACGAAENVTYTRSKVDSNGKFTCELLGFGADFDTDVWTFYTDDQIAAANGASGASDEQLNAALKKNAAIQDMVATQESGVNVMLIYEDTNVSKLGNISEEAYINGSKEGLVEQFADIMDNVNSKTTTVTVAGVTHQALDVSGETYGVSVYGRYICVKKGNLMGLISINAFSEQEIKDITAMFYALS